MFDLRQDTAPAWTETVLADLDTFLIDHAACERKASASAMHFVVRYPNRRDIVDTMTEVARDELEHFAQVTAIVHARGRILGRDVKDPYINPLLALVRGDSHHRLIDRLLIFGIVEGRGCERFRLLSEALTESDAALSQFYGS